MGIELEQVAKCYQNLRTGRDRCAASYVKLVRGFQDHHLNDYVEDYKCETNSIMPSKMPSGLGLSAHTSGSNPNVFCR